MTMIKEGPRLKDTFILRDNPDKNGYEAYHKNSDGEIVYHHSLVVGGPVSEHYIISNVEERRAGIRQIISHEGVMHSRKQALDEAYRIMHKYHTGSTIIDETSRAKENNLAQEVRENSVNPFSHPEKKSGPYHSGPPKVY